MESQENIGKVLISKQFPNTIKVSLSSYEAIYNTSIAEKQYLVLKNGAVVPGEKEELIDLVLKFAEIPTFYEYKRIISSQELKRIYEIDALMKTNFVTINYPKINYYIDEKEAHVILQ